MTFIRPVWARHLEFSAGLVPGSALCSGAGPAERPQEILWIQNENRKFPSTNLNLFAYTVLTAPQESIPASHLW